MRAVLTSEVWHGEFDRSEFTDGATVVDTRPGYVQVTEVLELGFMHQGTFITLASALAAENAPKLELIPSDDEDERAFNVAHHEPSDP